jgi:hypothetical protein
MTRVFMDFHVMKVGLSRSSRRATRAQAMTIWCSGDVRRTGVPDRHPYSMDPPFAETHGQARQSSQIGKSMG